MKLHEAKYYAQNEDNTVECGLCPHNCVITDNNTGTCDVRENRDGKLYTHIYERLTAIGMDPIEKKPLYHFYPGSKILSIGTMGCNLRCPYCQNYHISQNTAVNTDSYTAEQVIAAAIKHDSVGIAYTYSEPVIWYEYVFDTAVKAREKALKNVMVTNGFINEQPLRDILPYIDAMNIDLKSFNRETYRKVQKGKLDDVLRTIQVAYEYGCHVELTTLIVTGMNDTIEELQGIIDFIASLDAGIPWHISRYYPNYTYEQPATDINFILNVHEQAREKLHFVYCGNIGSSYGGSDTFCPHCNAKVVSRSGYFTRVESLAGDKCSSCGTRLYIRS